MTIRATMLRTAALAAFAGGVLGTVSSSVAQIDITPDAGGTITLPDAGPIRVEPVKRGQLAVINVNGNINGGKNDLAGALDAFVSNTLEEYRTAADDASRNAALAKLAAGFGEYFDRDMVRREGEVAKIQERLVKLQQLLERRRTKKQEIVELQVKVALNEADGLGFYENSRSDGKRAFLFNDWNSQASLKDKAWADREASDPFEPAILLPPTDAADVPFAAPVGTTLTPGPAQ